MCLAVITSDILFGLDNDAFKKMNDLLLLLPVINISCVFGTSEHYLQVDSIEIMLADIY